MSIYKNFFGNGCQVIWLPNGCQIYMILHYKIQDSEYKLYVTCKGRHYISNV